MTRGEYVRIKPSIFGTLSVGIPIRLTRDIGLYLSIGAGGPHICVYGDITRTLKGLAACGLSRFSKKRPIV